MKVGFIGLGNVGGKLANSLLKNGINLSVKDLDLKLMSSFKDAGAFVSKSPKELAENSDIIITCLPSPESCSEVMESDDGVINGISKNKIWIEMSTTDSNEVIRISELLKIKGAISLDAPVSGGCHRAETGNISIFVGGERNTFEKVLPILSFMGKNIIHTGSLGTASILKVITNFLATTHLVALGEALVLAKKTNINLNTAYKAIKISSGNSFVHETESQVILNGSYNINFTMDLVLKDINLFNHLLLKNDIPSEITTLLIKIFNDGKKKFGSKAWSSMIVKRLEDICNVNLRASGFPSELIDNDPQVKGFEV
tara:strand:+ start:210 stop:1151 length:942 start_codon:yes stop_codon:yes gene_type:complete